MSSFAFRVCLLTLIGFASACPIAQADPGDFVGHEYPLNPQYAPDVLEHASAIATTPDGRWVALFATGGYWSPRSGVYARFGAAPPLPQGSSTLALSEVSGYGFSRAEHSEPALAITDAGRIFAAWSTASPNWAGTEIFGQLLDADGTMLSESFRIDSEAQSAWSPKIAADKAGLRYAAAWVENASGRYLLRVRHYDAAMQPLADAVTLAEAALDVRPLALQVMADGGVDIAWLHWDEDEFGIRRAFVRLGRLVESESGVLVPYSDHALVELDTGFPPAVSVAFSGNESVVVAWERSDAEGTVIRAQGFNLWGLPLAEPIPVTDMVHELYAIMSPVVGAGADGSFTVVWEQWGQGDSGTSETNLYTRRFDAEGLPVGSPFRVNSFADGSQGQAAIAVDADGDTVIAWTSRRYDSEFTRDLSQLRARRMRGYGVVDLMPAIQAPSLVERATSIQVDIDVSNLVESQAGLPDGVDSASGVMIQVELPDGSILDSVGGARWECGSTDSWTRQFVCRHLDPIAPLAAGSRLSLNMRPFWTGLRHVTATVVESDQANVQPGNLQAQVSVDSADRTPNPFAYAEATGVVPGSEQVSASVTISGIDRPVAIVVANGEYSINGGAFTAEPGTIKANDRLRLKHFAADGFLERTETTVVVGYGSSIFASTTEAVDAMPDPFGFTDVDDVKRKRVVTSDSVVVTGINTEVVITTSGGQYSINGGAFTEVPGTLRSGDVLRLRTLSAQSSYTTVEVAVAVGDASTIWRVSTGR